jgi:hypothetical protein
VRVEKLDNGSGVHLSWIRRRKALTQRAQRKEEKGGERQDEDKGKQSIRLGPAANGVRPARFVFLPLSPLFSVPSVLKLLNLPHVTVN